ncbi:MAG: FCD domain-containing protein [Sporolactobacillus sp.]
MSERLLCSKIIEDIDHRIKEKLLLPNEKLPSERQMAAQYQVSRSVIREAVKVLGEKGLVDVRVGKGIYITKPTKNNLTKALKRVIASGYSTIEDIVDVREELELSAVKKAVVHAGAADLEDLASACRVMDTRPIRVAGFVHYDAQFHLQLAKLTGNEIFYLLINSFYEMTDKALFDITHMIPADIEEAQRQHWQIVHAVEERDTARAQERIKAHIDLIRSEISLLKEKQLI